MGRISKKTELLENINVAESELLRFVSTTLADEYGLHRSDVKFLLQRIRARFIEERRLILRSEEWKVKW